MHTGTHYKISEFLLWTRRDIYVLILLSAIPTILFQVFDLKWIAIPWVPVALVGTAAAFIVGFKNTQTYNRLWEARQIWGAIVNTSRTWGIMSKDFVHADKSEIQQLIYRHCAWLTALRFQLRKPQSWENTNKAHFKEYRSYFSIPEWEGKLEEELLKYLSAEEHTYVLSKKNRATQLISLQSKHLKSLKSEGKIDPFEYVEMERQLSFLYDHQGKAERIKNFPYPRQFASINLFFVWLLVLMLPFGMLNEFQKLGEIFVWLTIPFSVIVSWVFTSMEKVGEATENPFEGGANDIPMAALSRTIEIDLRDMLDESNLPEPVTPVNSILM
ncbi:bestrophin family protein [Belliella marina]|uniref:Bestrophin family protein n=1 Tax=Belliella marina TaxID=1644146 RepID=A0ABW4VSU7_9BACT